MTCKKCKEIDIGRTKRHQYLHKRAKEHDSSPESSENQHRPQCQCNFDLRLITSDCSTKRLRLKDIIIKEVSPQINCEIESDELINLIFWCLELSPFHSLSFLCFLACAPPVTAIFTSFARNTLLSRRALAIFSFPILFLAADCPSYLPTCAALFDLLLKGVRHLRFSNESCVTPKRCFQ